MFAHLGGTFLNLLVPLVIYLVHKDRDPFARQHSAQALNFHLTVLLAWAPLLAVYVAGVFATALTNQPAFILVAALLVLALVLALAVTVLVLTVRATVAAYDGRAYRYPVRIDFVQ
jgi:uncharacterized protein